MLVDAVLHIAGGEHARYAGGGGVAFAATLGDDITVFHLQLAGKNVGIRLVADGDEHAHQGNLFSRIRFDILDAHAGHAGLVAEHFVKHAIPLDGDLASLLLLENLVLNDFFAAQLVATMYQRHMAGDVGQIQRFFHRRIAAADDRDRLFFVEETVTGGAGRNALAGELFFRGQAEILRRSAGGDDQRVAGVFTGIANQPQRPFGQLGGVDMVEDHLGVEAQGVLLETCHQIGTLHAIGVGRPVVDICGRHQLAALGHAGDEHRAQVGAGSIDGGGITGRAGTENQ